MTTAPAPILTRADTRRKSVVTDLVHVKNGHRLVWQSDIPAEPYMLCLNCRQRHGGHGFLGMKSILTNPNWNFPCQGKPQCGDGCETHETL